MRSYLFNRGIRLVLTTTIVACGGSNLTLPDDGSGMSLRVVSGDGQEATVGSELPNPLVVRLTDGAARAVVGASVAFRFESQVPGAKVEPATVATNSDGDASVRVRLGATTGQHTVEARLNEEAGSGLRATFGLTALERRQGDDGDEDDDDEDDDDEDDD